VEVPYSLIYLLLFATMLTTLLLRKFPCSLVYSTTSSYKWLLTYSITVDHHVPTVKSNQQHQLYNKKKRKKPALHATSILHFFTFTDTNMLQKPSPAALLSIACFSFSSRIPGVKGKKLQDGDYLYTTLLTSLRHKVSLCYIALYYISLFLADTSNTRQSTTTVPSARV
jgi:hypothetical protein